MGKAWFPYTTVGTSQGRGERPVCCSTEVVTIYFLSMVDYQRLRDYARRRDLKVGNCEPEYRGPSGGNVKVI